MAPAKRHLNLQISCLKLNVHLKNNLRLELHQTFHRFPLSDSLWISKIWKGVNNYAGNIGGAKTAPCATWLVTHPPPPPPPSFYFGYSKGHDNESLPEVWWNNVWYFLNGLIICEFCKFSANLSPPIWTAWLVTPPPPPPPPFLFRIFKWDLTLIVYAKINEFLTTGIFQMGLKFKMLLPLFRIPYIAIKPRVSLFTKKTYT